MDLKITFLLSILIGINAFSQKKMLDASMHHLRNGNPEEWKNFSQHPAETQLVLNFSSDINSTEYCLSLRQSDVKQLWQVLLNNQLISPLVIDGNDMKVYFRVSPGLLIPGQNELKIISASKVVDDIEVGEIILDARPLNQVLTEAELQIEIRGDNSNVLLPSRITVVDSRGSLHTTGTEPSKELAIRPGMIYTTSGRISLQLPAGKYTIYAGRGFEYNIDSFQVTLRNGQKLQRIFRLKREVNTKGWVSSDTHLHTLTYSGHGDASDVERAITIAGEGIELPVITEHNLIADLTPRARELKLDRYYTVIPGDEVTTTVGHFNYFPLNENDEIPNYKAHDWDSLGKSFDKNKITILNHGRDIHNQFRPLDPRRHISIAGKNLQDWTLPANAMEVVNSGALLNYNMELIEDWFGLLNHGFQLTPVGGSDSHDVGRYIVGQARTYIKVKDEDPSKIHIDEAVQHFKEGKVMVSFGLLAAIKVNGKYGPGEMSPASNNNVVEVQVSGPSWINADSVALYANGIKIYKQGIRNKKSGGVKWKATWPIKKQKQDLFLVAVAEGDQKSLPYWPIVKPFQPTSDEWSPYVIGCSGAVWLDMDGDGKPTTAFEYASRIVDQYPNNLNGLIKQLNQYDGAVTVQAVRILMDRFVDPYSREFLEARKFANRSTELAIKRLLRQESLSTIDPYPVNF